MAKNLKHERKVSEHIQYLAGIDWGNEEYIPYNIDEVYTEGTDAIVSHLNTGYRGAILLDLKGTGVIKEVYTFTTADTSEAASIMTKDICLAKGITLNKAGEGTDEVSRPEY